MFVAGFEMHSSIQIELKEVNSQSFQDIMGLFRANQERGKWCQCVMHMAMAMA